MAIKIMSKPKASQTTVMKEKGKTIAEDTKELAVDEKSPSSAEGNSDPTIPWCQVGFSNSYTHNLGDFKSTRVEVSLVIPCKHAEIDKVYAFAENWVDSKLSPLVATLTGEE